MRSIVLVIILVWGSLVEEAFNGFGNYFGFRALGVGAFNSFGNYFGFGALEEEALNSFGNYFGLGGIG